MKYPAILLTAFLIAPLAQAQDMPCVKVEKVLLDDMQYLNARNDKDFSACIIQHRVCLLTDRGEVLKAQEIRNVPLDSDSVTFGIVQTPPNEKVTLCLSGAFSGGSAAAWVFRGWQFDNNTPRPLSNMSKGQLDNDAVPARTLAKMIYDVYEKFGKEAP